MCVWDVRRVTNQAVKNIMSKLALLVLIMLLKRPCFPLVLYVIFVALRKQIPYKNK